MVAGNEKGVMFLPRIREERYYQVVVVVVGWKNQHTQLIIIFWWPRKKLCSPAGGEWNYDTLASWYYVYARRRVADRTIRLPEDIIGHCYYPVQIIYCDNYLRRRVDQVQRLLCSFFLGTQTKAFTDSLASNKYPHPSLVLELFLFLGTNQGPPSVLLDSLSLSVCAQDHLHSIAINFCLHSRQLIRRWGRYPVRSSTLHYLCSAVPYLTF